MLKKTQKDLKQDILDILDKPYSPKIIKAKIKRAKEQKIHQPYLVCNSETKRQIGKDCGRMMLRDLYEKFHENHKTIVLIAHNAGYDFKLLQKHL
jgi:hypothetical protein